MVLQKMDAKWSKVTVPYGSKLFEGYMLNEKIGSEEQVIKTVKLSGIGEVEINASTTYSATGGDKLVFGVRKLFDQNLLTSWCEGVEDGEGIDESIEMKFPNKILISSVEIVNGYTKSEEDYKMTNRIKKMAWETYDADGNRMASGDCEFKDEVYDFQTCGISSSVTINKIKLIIREIYKGEKYPKSTCFSEIKLMKAN
jgi:hypothetical protein